MLGTVFDDFDESIDEYHHMIRYQYHSCSCDCYCFRGSHDMCMMEEVTIMKVMVMKMKVKIMMNDDDVVEVSPKDDAPATTAMTCL
jgi:hypothetical protein